MELFRLSFYIYLDIQILPNPGLHGYCSFWGYSPHGILRRTRVIVDAAYFAYCDHESSSKKKTNNVVAVEIIVLSSY